MHTPLALAAVVAADDTFDPATTAGRLRAALVAFIAVALALASLFALFTYGRKGDTSRAAKMVLACIICLLPVAIAAPIALGKDVLGWTGIG